MRWSDKDPAEIVPVGFELADALASGEAPIAVSAAVTLIAGTDPAPSDLLLGSAAIVATSVQQWLTGGVDGCDYRVTFTTDTDGGKRLVEAGVVRCRAKS
ncbi:MAG: hypothetical protein MUC64_13885 [Rubritepida sp.]|jgi:hypothetical protein|nr:hypothetical protein [Rubritepida sp.]